MILGLERGEQGVGVRAAFVGWVHGGRLTLDWPAVAKRLGGLLRFGLGFARRCAGVGEEGKINHQEHQGHQGRGAVGDADWSAPHQ
jgi:hypothetical protein